MFHAEESETIKRLLEKRKPEASSGKQNIHSFIGDELISKLLPPDFLL